MEEHYKRGKRCSVKDVYSASNKKNWHILFRWKNFFLLSDFFKMLIACNLHHHLNFIIFIFWCSYSASLQSKRGSKKRLHRSTFGMVSWSLPFIRPTPTSCNPEPENKCQLGIYRSYEKCQYFQLSSIFSSLFLWVTCVKAFSGTFSPLIWSHFHCHFHFESVARNPMNSDSNPRLLFISLMHNLRKK